MSDSILETQLFQIICNENLSEDIKCAKIDMLIKLGANVNARLRGKSVLCWAKDEKLKDVAKILLSNGAKEIWPFVSSKAVKDSFLNAILENDIEMAKIIVDDVKNIRDDGKNVLNDGLRQAIFMDRKEIVELLVDNGVDANKENDDFTTPLMIAVVEKKEDIVELLLQKGADAYKENKNGSSAFDIAKVDGYEDIKKIILKNAKVNNSVLVRAKSGYSKD